MTAPADPARSRYLVIIATYPQLTLDQRAAVAQHASDGALLSELREVAKRLLYGRPPLRPVRSLRCVVNDQDVTKAVLE